MNYRHAFHAGNFADVFKHLMLVRMLVYLTRKDAALRFIDTHAGIGSYDLGSEAAARTGEWRDGFGRLESAILPPALAPLIMPYLEAVTAHRTRTGLPQSYPGSPALAAQLLRPQDKIALCELHQEDARELARNMRRDLRVNINPIDGYTALRSYLPPIERRGLVLVDPPFEQTDEFGRLAQAIATAWRKWPGGVYCVWYPVKDATSADKFFDNLTAAGVRNLLRLELSVAALRKPSGDQNQGLVSNGLAIINPPYLLADAAKQILPFLRDVLAQGTGAKYAIEQVVGE